MPFTAENAASIARYARSQRHGLNRAAFWRSLGFPNCVLARAAKAEKARLKKLAETRQDKPRSRNLPL